MKRFLTVLCLLSSVLWCRAVQTTVLYETDDNTLKRPTAANLISANGLITAATVNGYFADPSTNASFSASAWRSDLGLVIGTNVQAYSANLTTFAAIAPSANVQSLLGAADYSAMRTQLGLVIGTNVQAFDSDLTAVAGLASNGLMARTGTGTAAVRTLTGPAAGISVSNGDGVSGNPTLALANDLSALEGLASTGFAVRSATDTWVQRSIAGTSPVQVANGTGVSGNPTISVDAATTSASGIVELATTAETLAGTDTARANTPAGGEARALYGTISRPVKDALYSAGATASRRAEWTGGTAAAVAALPITLLGEFQTPTSNPSADSDFASFLPSIPVTNVNSLRSVLRNDGGLILYSIGASINDRRQFLYSGFRTAYSGLWVRIAAVFTGDTTTSPTVYINGIDVSASFTLTTAGTPPNWMPTTLDSTKFVSGLNFPAGRFIPHGPILGALTAAEVLEWTQTGRLPTWCEIGTGNAVDKAVAGDFATDPTAVASPNTWTLDSGVTWDAANFELDFATAGSAWARTQSSSGASVWLRAGQRYLVKFTIKNYVSGTLVLANGSIVTFSVAYGSNGASANGTYAYEVLPTIDTRVCFGSSSALNLSLDDVKVYVLGPIFKPVIQPGVTLRDTGSNNLPGILTSGITPITMGDRGAFTATLTWSGTHEGKSLLGAQAIPSNAIVTRIWRKATVASSGTGCTIGTTTTAARWQALDTYTTAAEIATLANQLPAGTAANDLDIVVDPDTANYTGSITVTVEYQIVGGTP